MMPRETIADRDARLNRQARRAANAANAELARVESAFRRGAADIHDVRAARRDAQYWNQIVNQINGYL